jgi:hypothetical protein
MEEDGESDVSYWDVYLVGEGATSLYDNNFPLRYLLGNKEGSTYKRL